VCRPSLSTDFLKAPRPAALTGGSAPVPTGVARFEYRAEEHLSDLRARLLAGTYRPGAYVHFRREDPRRRKISAVQFDDRVVHHALCNIIEPRFERLFIPESYANRVGKGTHRAVDRLQTFAQRYRYVLRADIVQHFASVDHAILLEILRIQIPEPDVMALESMIWSNRNAISSPRGSARACTHLIGGMVFVALA
jgi:retron-type reverse transcriptase